MQIQQYHSLSQQHITGSQSMKLVSAKQFRYITKKDSDSDLVQISCKQLCSQWWTKLQQPAVVPGVLAHLLFPLPSSTLSPSPPFTASTLSHQLSSLPFFISPSLPLLFLTSFTSFLSHAFISHPQIQLRVGEVLWALPAGSGAETQLKLCKIRHLHGGTKFID